VSADASQPPLPNLVIAGAPRCGTTSLFSWLKDHPQVGAATVKETFYLMDSVANNDFLRDAFDHGKYVEHLRPWFLRCGCDRIRIVILEELRVEPRRVLQGLAGWLGIDERFYREYTFPRHNESYRVRSRGLQRINEWVRERVPGGAVRDRLRDVYRRLNTARPADVTTDERVVLEGLDRAYEPSNRALAAEFGLDLSSWEAPRIPKA